MTTKPTRADLVRQRRSSRLRSTQAPHSSSGRLSVPAPAAKRSHSPATVHPPMGASRLNRSQFSAEASQLRLQRMVASGSVQRPPLRAAHSSYRRPHYDLAFSLGNTSVRAPAFSLPEFGPRWLSGALTLLLAFALYMLWNSSTFTVSAAEVSGNARLSNLEINAVLGIIGQPIFKADPQAIVANLRTAYPDLAAVEAHVALPNQVKVEVVERVPVLAWYQSGAMTWIDAEGVAFLPRGEAPGLIQVVANGFPPKVEGMENAPVYEQKFIAPQLVKAMIELSPYLPPNVPLIYDPRYGMGWQDSHGWFVYFGQTAEDIPAKLVIYQSITASFLSQGIQPSLVSLEYKDAPFYK